MFLLSLFISFIALILILVDHLEKKKKNFSDKIINKNNDLNKLSIQKSNTLTSNTKPFSNIPTTIYESETKILDKTEFNMNGYNKDGFNRFGFDYKGFDKNGFNKFGFNKHGINRDGFNKFGFDKHGFDKFGFNKLGYHKETKTLFDKQGFDKDGYNHLGWNKKYIHKITKSNYDLNGFDKDGFDKQGLNKFGVSKDRFNKIQNNIGVCNNSNLKKTLNASSPNNSSTTKDSKITDFDKDGFDKFGFDKQGFGKTGFNMNGYDRQGFNKQGFNFKGFDKDGFNKLGFDKFGFDRNGLDKNGFDILGFDKDGFNKQGISIHNSICKNTNTSSSQDFNKKDFYTDNKEIDIKKVKEQPLNNDLSNLADFPNIDTTNSTLHFASQTSSKKIETSYSYIMDYYSKSKNIEVGEEEEKNRNLVYDFKDGKNKDYFVNLIKNYMIKNNILKENLTIVPIPASSSSKNHKRFYQLFKELSDSLSIENGFDYIKVVSDREAKHLSKNRECCDKNYEIDYDKIKNKNILLIDDIITTGTGFSKLSNELLKNGSREVNGLFLAKTVKTSNENKIEKQNNSPSSSKEYETTSLNNYKKSNPYEQYGVILGEDGHYYNNIGDKIISPDRYFEAIKQRISN